MEIQTNAKKGLIFTSAVLLLYYFGDASPSHEGQISLPYIPVTLRKPQVIGWFAWLLFFLYWWRFYLDGRAVWDRLKYSIQQSAAEDPYFRRFIKKTLGRVDSDTQVFRVDNPYIVFDSFLGPWRVSAMLERRVPVSDQAGDVTLVGGTPENVECIFGRRHMLRKLWYALENALTSKYFFDSVLPHIAAAVCLYFWFPYLFGEWPKLMLSIIGVGLLVVFAKGVSLREGALDIIGSTFDTNSAEREAD